MKYQGSKRRIAKYLLSIIMQCVEDKNTIFYDVCCGGANLISKVPLKNRVAIDKDEYLIEALKVIRDNPEWLPKNNKELTEQDYREIKNNKDKYPKWLVGYVGYPLSWGSKWFGGYCRDKKKRDYVAEAYRSALKQSKLLQGVKFICASYDEIKYNKNSVIYVDPPYADTTKYKINFNYNKFWNWVEKMSKQGYKIFVSEYSAPENFTCIWQKELENGLANLNGKKENKRKIEKLFILKKQTNKLREI